MYAKSQKIKMYSEIVRYLFSTYATTYAVNEAVNEVHHLRAHLLTVQEYVVELVEQVLRCGDVFEDNELKGIFFERLTYKTRQDNKHYWSTHRSKYIHALIICVI